MVHPGVRSNTLTAMARPVTLLSDFGVLDEFAGVMEAVIAGIAPDARVIHLTHGVTPQGVMQGALALAQAVPYTPPGVHVAVVDPGVGSERRAVVIVTGDGRLLVGPDNGVLVPAAEGCGGIEAAYEIADENLFLHPVSSTFHGRDVFAPVAARLAAGLDPSAVGPAVDPAGLRRIDVPAPHLEPGTILAQALDVDRFGNVALNVRGADLDGHGLPAGARVEIAAGDGRYFAVRATTFADVRPGEMVLYDDSSGWASLAVNRGSLAEVCGIERGDPVLLRLA
jgi:S-adenosyl-L-methionine hydrolase (adenosine-forming)